MIGRGRTLPASGAAIAVRAALVGFWMPLLQEIGALALIAWRPALIVHNCKIIN